MTRQVGASGEFGCRARGLITTLKAVLVRLLWLHSPHSSPLCDWRRGILGSIRVSHLHPSRSLRKPHSLNFSRRKLNVSRLCVLAMRSSSRFLFLSHSVLE